MSDAVAIIEEELPPARSKNPLLWERFEFIYGTEYSMSSPNAVHQVISVNMSCQLKDFFKGKSCMHFTAFDVYILADLGDTKRPGPPETGWYYGAPPFIIEILSQDRSHDLLTKLNLYYRAGVAEYVVIDPENKIVMVFARGERACLYQAYPFTDRVPSSFFPDLALDLSFDQPF